MANDARTTISFSNRLYDQLCVAYFGFSLLLIYLFLVEQVTVGEIGFLKPVKFAYPVWPPPPVVDLTHKFARAMSPLLVARPVWWKALVWSQILISGPAYVLSIFCFMTSKEWIRVWTVMGCAVSATMALVKGAEEGAGAFAAKQQEICFYINLALFAMPVAIISYLVTNEHPFTRKIVSRKKAL